MNSLLNIHRNLSNIIAADEQAKNSIERWFYNKSRNSIQFIGKEGTLTGVFNEDKGVITFSYRTDETREQGLGDKVAVINIEANDKGVVPYELSKDSNGTLVISRIPEVYKKMVMNFAFNRDALEIDKEPIKREDKSYNKPKNGKSYSNKKKNSYDLDM